MGLYSFRSSQGSGYCPHVLCYNKVRIFNITGGRGFNIRERGWAKVSRPASRTRCRDPDENRILLDIGVSQN